MNPMDVKRGIDAAVETVKESLVASAKKVKDSDEIAQVGTISANGDKEIGTMIAKAMQKVGNEGVITVEENKGIETELDVTNMLPSAKIIYTMYECMKDCVTENGKLLHTKDYESRNTMKVSKQVKLTCSTEIISDIAQNKGPKQFFISLGYSGWGPGQLEDEIKQNSWININEELDLLFEVDPEKKWKDALKKTGIDFSKLSNYFGNA